MSVDSTYVSLVVMKVEQCTTLERQSQGSYASVDYATQYYVLLGRPETHKYVLWTTTPFKILKTKEQHFILTNGRTAAAGTLLSNVYE